MVPLHAELRESRERKGFTLEEIHAATRINPDFLESIERGDFRFLPAPYIRLFLRTYANQVGMDPHYVLDRYEEIERPTGTEEQAAEGAPAEKQRPMSWGSVAGLAGVFVLLGYAGVALFEGGTVEAPPTALRGPLSPGVSLVGGNRDEQKPTDSAAPAFQRASLATPPDTPEVGAVVAAGTTPEPQGPPPSLAETEAYREIPHGIAWTEADSVLALSAAGLEPTWAYIAADGSPVFRGMIQSGEHLTWKAGERFSVVAGRRGGVEFTLQGKALPDLWPPRSGVLRISITRTGVTRERPPPQEVSPDSLSSAQGEDVRPGGESTGATTSRDILPVAPAGADSVPRH